MQKNNPCSSEFGAVSFCCIATATLKGHSHEKVCKFIPLTLILTAGWPKDPLLKKLK
jgi:hypothetical protein